MKRNTDPAQLTCQAWTTSRGHNSTIKYDTGAEGGTDTTRDWTEAVERIDIPGLAMLDITGHVHFTKTTFHLYSTTSFRRGDMGTGAQFFQTGLYTHQQLPQRDCSSTSTVSGRYDGCI